MGEIAEAMLDGVFCQQCGEYIDEGCGYPQLCPACQEEEDREEDRKSMDALSERKEDED